MKAALVTGALALATWMAFGGVAAAKEWKGKWHPGSHSTLEFIGAGRLVYCYEENCIKTAYSEPFLKVHRDSLEAAIPDLYLKDQAEYFRVLNEWLFRALAGDVSPEVALDRVAQRWTLIANRSDRKVQQERWSRLRDKYPPAARNLLRDLN